MEIYSVKEIANAIKLYMAREWKSIKDFCEITTITKPTYYSITRLQAWYITRQTIEKLKKSGVI